MLPAMILLGVLLMSLDFTRRQLTWRWLRATRRTTARATTARRSAAARDSTRRTTPTSLRVPGTRMTDTLTDVEPRYDSRGRPEPTLFMFTTPAQGVRPTLWTSRKKRTGEYVVLPSTHARFELRN